jgi:DNA (cytosine-5)-methyltransferase 1
MPIYGGSDANTSDTVTSKWAKGSGGPAGNECGLFVAQPIAYGVSEKPDVGHCLRSGASKADKHESTTYVAQPIAFSRNDDGGDATNDLAPTMRVAGNAGGMLAAAMATHDIAGTMLSRNTSGGFSNSIDHAAAGYMAIQAMAVRRLTPVECERLQGFPDRYTDIQPKGKATPDGPRYKALGNSMAVPVMGWIGKRIQQVNALL